MGNFVVGDVLAGKYEINAVLGAGGMGTVYRARQIDLGRDVAIKVPMPAALEIPGFLTRFSREAKLVAKLVHDNIVQVYEYQETQDAVYIVMEYVEGQDMKSLIMKPPSDMTVKDVAEVLRSSCEGLGHAHEAGIVHRDIKPHNIMVQQRARGKWRVKIMDFGIAHLDANTNLTMHNEQLTVTGQAIGTPSYMSPEQIRGTGVTGQSDIYSFGCVAFFAFTRQTPFQGTGFTVAAAHLSDVPPPIRGRVPSLPPALEDVINRCLAKDPAHRPSNAEDLGQAFYDALQPIFDMRMAEIWPVEHNAGGGTDVIKATKPLDPTIQTLSAASDRTLDANEPTGARTVPLRDSAAIPRAVAPSITQTPTNTAQPDKSAETIPYPKAVVPATFPPTPVPVGPLGIPQKYLLMGGAGLACLLVIGVTAGLAIKNRLDGKRNTGQTNVVVAQTNDRPTDPERPTVTPTATVTPTPDQEVIPATAAPPATTTESSPIATPVPTSRETPVPTATTDLKAIRLASLQENFKRENDLRARAQLWRQAVTDRDFATDEDMVRLAEEMALEIAKNPAMVPITGSTYTIGSDTNPFYDAPSHNVRLSKYEIGRYEVTALEFSAYLNNLPAEDATRVYTVDSRFNIENRNGLWFPREGRELHPVNGVTWQAAVDYTQWLSTATKSQYRLPTEAEWEVAASGGTRKSFPWGDGEPSPERANFSSEQTIPVFELNSPNMSDLAHVAGNVGEWCSDWYDADAYPTDRRISRTDPPGPEKPTTSKVHRGGSYSSPASELGVSVRGRETPTKASPDIGFRLVRKPD